MPWMAPLGQLGSPASRACEPRAEDPSLCFIKDDPCGTAWSSRVPGLWTKGRGHLHYQYSVTGVEGSAARMYTVVCCHYSVTDVDAVTLYAYAVVCISDVLACYYEYINIGVYTILTFPGTTRVPWVPTVSPPPTWQGGVREPSRQVCHDCWCRRRQNQRQNAKR